ncbi:ATP-binding protein [Actinomyces sp.]|uniref:ATP-binding protein n=1 Tax=Actinomyces sp. TaxID=29317 RepID=UPI0026DA797F|nr:ATP-binding protein [Actinomyces sp.]MDO4900172.1 ATP-binding protein [Actinomyces sp.]
MTAVPPLTLSFDPRTIEHLGIRMYSHVPNAVAELVANAYDADATQVEVKVGSDHSITVIDDGHGMSRQDVADKYLRIGRNRRQSPESGKTESGRRWVSGKKGLGKLALFGIGRVVEVTTTRMGSSTATRITMSYDDLITSEGDYRPEEDVVPIDADRHGTTVVLTQLRRKTPIDGEKLASSLSRLFNYADDNFTLMVTDAQGNRTSVSRSLRLQSLDKEFEWTLPDKFTEGDIFLADQGVSGVIISTAKPLRNVPRGVTLYAHGRMVDEPEFFGASESSHAYSYITGYLDVDFVDTLDEDVIATDRRALVWDAPEMEKLRESLERLLTRVGREWRARRSQERKARGQRRTGISTEDWTASIKSEESRSAVETVLEHVSSEDLDLTADQEAVLIEDLHRLAPPYADYVWRRLHPEIQEVSKTAYEGGSYHTAIVEGIKRYIANASAKAGIPRKLEHNVIEGAFGKNKKLSIFKKYMHTHAFTDTTADNIENGHREISLGLYKGFRHPISHEEVKELQESGALTYEDCLDALSILSHLMRRLDGAELRPEAKN